MFVVQEGSSACISLQYLDASDNDSKPEELTFFLETSPQYGYLENIFSTPGYEKSNAGINISELQILLYLRDICKLSWCIFTNEKLSSRVCTWVRNVLTPYSSENTK